MSRPVTGYRGKLRARATLLRQRLVRELEQEVLRLGPEQGHRFIARRGRRDLGLRHSGAGYFRGVREICDKYGMLLILDEVMCGMGAAAPLRCEQEMWCPTSSA